jgi:hypothetical protein
VLSHVSHNLLSSPERVRNYRPQTCGELRFLFTDVANAVNQYVRVPTHVTNHGFRGIARCAEWIHNTLVRRGGIVVIVNATYTTV